MIFYSNKITKLLKDNSINYELLLSLINTTDATKILEKDYIVKKSSNETSFNIMNNFNQVTIIVNMSEDNLFENFNKIIKLKAFV